MGKPRIKTAMPFGADEYGPTPLGRLIGANKASDTQFIPIYNEIQFDGGEGDTLAYQEYQGAMKAALGLLRVNVSLAIRKAFDAIHDLRAQKGGPFHPSEFPAVKRQSPVPENPA